MDVRRLETLLMLSRLGSMRAVAEETHTTTSTVSQQIAALAREAGTPLIEPDGRRVRLTPAGRRLAEHAVTILAALEAARLDLDPAAEPAGTLRVAGKPYQPIYEEAFRLAEVAAGKPLEKSCVLAIGDSVRTDATGAAKFGIDLLFITGSIHAAELDAFGKPDPQAIADLIAPSRARTAGYLPRLTW